MSIDLPISDDDESPVFAFRVGHAQMYTADVTFDGTQIFSSEDLDPNLRSGAHEVQLPSPPGELHDKMLTLAVLVIPPEVGGTQLYSVDAAVLQAGREIAGSGFHENGTIRQGMEPVVAVWWVL